MFFTKKPTQFEFRFCVKNYQLCIKNYHLTFKIAQFSFFYTSLKNIKYICG